MSFLKKIFGKTNKPGGTTVICEVSKDVVHRFLGQITPQPTFAQLKYMHPNIPDIHLAVLMYSASETARAMPNPGENQAMELAMKSCQAYDQGRFIVTESSWTYHVLASTD
jgi:hypothetical protein